MATVKRAWLVAIGMLLSASVCGAARQPATTQSTVEALQRQWRQRGEPATLEDLAPADVPDAENAAVLIQRAADEVDDQDDHAARAVQVTTSPTCRLFRRTGMNWPRPTTRPMPNSA